GWGGWRGVVPLGAYAREDGARQRLGTVGLLAARGMGPSPWRLDVYSVDLGRRVMEHRRAFGRRVGPGEPFERVVHHVIGKGDFVRRKVAFGHAPLRTEVLNTVLHPRRHGGGHFLRADGDRPGVPVESTA